MNNFAVSSETGLGAKVKKVFLDNIVIIIFFIICIFGVYFAGLTPMFIANELVARITRNLFLVLSLIIPIIAGMGLNFGIVVGAMAAQIAMVMVINWDINGLGGFLLSMAITIPLAALFGFFTGKLLNRCKGRETITSLILGFFADGLYQLLFLFLIGGVIPVSNKNIILESGIGVKNSIDLDGRMKYALDGILKAGLGITLIILGTLLLLYFIYKILHEKKQGELSLKNIRISNGSRLAGSGLVLALGLYIHFMWPAVNIVRVPIITALFSILLFAGNTALFRTKLGQDFRSIGQDMKIAKAMGINVDKTRVIAIILSTVLAGIGQLIFLQNIGTINTYGSHSQVGLFACAALLIGGASIDKATSGQALLGVILFHMLFILSPMAGKNIFGSPQIGEYFRVFVAYGVIGLSIAMYSLRKYRAKKMLY
jgi:simple sugar transport system permease protein